MGDIIKFNPDGTRVLSLDQRIGALYVEGYSIREIGKVLSITFGEVRRALLREGIQLRKPGQKFYLFSPKQMRTMVELYRKGYSGPQIAARYNTSGRNVYRVLENAGVPRRSVGCRGRSDG